MLPFELATQRSHREDDHGWAHSIGFAGYWPDWREDWKYRLRPGNDLIYSVAAVDPAARARCEAALIFAHQPPENLAYRTAFPFDKTVVKLAGKIDLLNPAFIVNRT